MLSYQEGEVVVLSIENLIAVVSFGRWGCINVILLLIGNAALSRTSFEGSGHKGKLSTLSSCTDVICKNSSRLEKLQISL